MYTYTYIIYWTAGSSSILVFVTPLLSAYFRLDLLLTWLNENILTCFDIALDIFSIIISRFIPCSIIVRIGSCSKKIQALLNYGEVPGFWVLSFTRPTELGGKRRQTKVQIAGDTCCTEISCRTHLEINSGRDLFLKRMAPFNLILIKREYS